MASGAPTPPERDSSSARGPGHEKFPSWPVAALADAPPPMRAPPTGGSVRSKSFTDHTEYPKEQPLTYTRPYMKRQHHTAAAYTKQLKTVMERCEQLGGGGGRQRGSVRHGLPCVDREGVALGQADYAVPSPPERDAAPLCQASLEAAYARSEGYHSLVSSADSATPLLDRLLGAGDEPLIAHSARVPPPQRHRSESVLYLEQRPRYAYLDPDKKHRVSDPALKAIQKQALLSFYERHRAAAWRSEPQLAGPQAPPPPPRARAPHWRPARPPKSPALRAALRPPSPPPPSPPPTPPAHSYHSDEPLPPPPPPHDLQPAPARPPRPWPPPPPLHPRHHQHEHHQQHMSASKASYLAARREREAALCGGDAGSYKRTMSPGGECPRLQPAPAITATPLICKSSVNVVRRPSTRGDKPPPAPLPDVLPPRFQTPPASPCASPQPLQLMQRTEVTLRVNATTSDAGCQTTEEDLKKTPEPGRTQLPEEIECERLQQDLVQQLGSKDSLKCILVPGPEHRKPTDYISASGLFKLEVTSRIRLNSTTPPSSPTSSPQPSSELSPSSAYFTTSEPKAKFLTSLASNTNLNCINRDCNELERKKEELVSRLARKLQVLKAEAHAVSEERRVNEELGASVARRVSRSARPPETAKFRLHVDEVGQITALLLGLSGRLARAENALMSLDEIDAERKSLEDKRDKLATQLSEAKQLKESIDRRSGHVSNMLVQYLTADEYADYDHFINMKAKLIMDSRDIADKIKLGEEQLQALRDTLG